MKIDYIGYCVKSIPKAKQQFELLGYEFSDTINDTARNVEIAFGINGNYKIELVAPKSSASSPVDGLLKKNWRNTLSHLL